MKLTSKIDLEKALVIDWLLLVAMRSTSIESIDHAANPKTSKRLASPLCRRKVKYDDVSYSIAIEYL